MQSRVQCIELCVEKDKATLRREIGRRHFRAKLGLYLPR